MPRSIRILSMALAVGLVLACLAGPQSAWADNQQHIKFPFILPYQHPDMTALELMQLGKEMVEQKEIRARLKAGDKIEYGQLTVKSQPEGSGVLVSSYVPLGQTPYTNDKLLPGLQRVTVRKEGYYEQVRMVEIKASQRASVDFTLQPIPYARLTVKVRPPTTKVKIVDVEEPYTPGMKLVPGRYLVSLNHPMYGEQRLCVVLGEQEELTLNGDLAAPPGKLRVESNPSNATVYLDGRDVGRTPYYKQFTWLPPGPHLVQVWESLFKPVSKVVQVESYKEKVIKIDLIPAEHFTNSAGMEFVNIPAGQFMMGFNGSPEFLAERIQEKFFTYRGEGIKVYKSFFHAFPQHLVQITRSFFMQTTEVTNAQWDMVMGTASPEREAQLPKRSISIEDAKIFIAKLNQRDRGKYHYRLPTEAEWEYAARAGTKSLFNTGDYITNEQANFIGVTCLPLNRIYGKRHGKPTKVKTFSPNPWGLYNMHGNVKELCADYFDGFFYTQSPVKDPIGAGREGDYYIARGGCYISDWSNCMSGCRWYTKKPLDIYGIRLVAVKTKLLALRYLK